MAQQAYSEFIGLDLRLPAQAGNPQAFQIARNVDLTIGGGVKARAQFAPKVNLPPESLGLYTVNGVLRTAIPANGTDPLPAANPTVVYDYLSIAPDTAIRIAGVVAWNNQPYICIERYVDPLNPDFGTIYEHHFVQNTSTTPYIVTGDVTNGSAAITSITPALPTLSSDDLILLPGEANYSRIASGGGSTVTLTQAWAGTTQTTVELTVLTRTDTKVSLNFNPGPAIGLHSRKIWAAGDGDNTVHFSSTVNGPLDWTAIGDAGFLPVAQHTAGDARIRGFGQFAGKLAIFFADTVQLWDAGIDPAQHALVDAVGGAGTIFADSVVNVLGDLVYFAQGGFRSLSAVVTTGQANDGDIGAPIQAITRTIQAAPAEPKALWSSSRAQLLCAIGKTIYAYTKSPVSRISGWTIYEVPWAVESLVELEGTLYIRANNQVFAADDTYTAEPGFAWAVRTSFLAAGGIIWHKAWQTIESLQTGVCSTKLLYDVNDATKHTVGPVIGRSTIGGSKYPLPVVSQALALEFAGTEAWEMAAFVLRYRSGSP